jgi:hypothetical protein
MVGSFVKLVALVTTLGLGCAAVALSVAVVGLWMLDLAQGGAAAPLQAELWRYLARAP